MQYYATWLQERQQISPPTLLVERWGEELTVGPKSAAVMVLSAQGQAVTPDGKAIGKQGPSVAAVMPFMGSGGINRAIVPPGPQGPRLVGVLGTNPSYLNPVSSSGLPKPK